MAHKDHLLYFDLYGRAEPIRMLYKLAGQEFTDERLQFAQWPALKPTLPLEQLPTLTTKEGVLSQSNVIARYVAKKLGMVGSGLWDETLNDLVMETCLEFTSELINKVHMWKLFLKTPEPENSAEIIEEVKVSLLKKVDYIKSIADKRGKTFLLGDKIQLADVWLYCTLGYGILAFPNILQITPWVKNFTSNFESNSIIKKHLAERPASLSGV